MHALALSSSNGPGSAVTVSFPSTTAHPSADLKTSSSSQENLFGINTSDEDVSDGEIWAPMPVRGYLSKWTNLLHGWQERFFILSNGMLNYYRNADELDLGSRGSVSIKNADVKAHEYDECRFEVRVGDSIWYLRGFSSVDRQNWISAIERHRIAESGHALGKTIHRPSSLISLNSTHSPSTNSSSSFKRGLGFSEKLAELTTFKDILSKQVDSLQTYFDTCASITQSISSEKFEKLLNDESISNCSNGLYYEDDSDSFTQATKGTYSTKKFHVGRDCFDSMNLYHHSTMFSGSERPCNVKDNQTVHLQDSSNQYKSLNTNSIENLSSGDGKDDPDLLYSSLCADAIPTPKANRKLEQTVENPSAKSITGSFFSRFLPFRSTFSSNAINQPTICNESSLKPEQSVVKDLRPPIESYALRMETRLGDLKRILNGHGSYAPDFKADAHMFKVTATGILTTLSHTVEMMQQQEDHWRRRFEREIEKRRRLEETQRAMVLELAQLRQLLGLNKPFSTSAPNPVVSVRGHSRFSSYGSIDFHHHLPEGVVAPLGQRSVLSNSDTNGVMPHGTLCDTVKNPATSPALYHLLGPDFGEGPNSPIRDEEFYDAIDAESDKMEQDEARLAALKSAGEAIRWATAMSSNHPIYNELNRAVKKHIKNFANSQTFNFAKPLNTTNGNVSISNVNEGNNSVADTGNKEQNDWQILVEDGDMIIFKRELETDDGIVLDPLQAIHVINGVTAREMCTYFWDVRYRLDWEFTIDQAPTILEVCGDDTVVTHQVYKRVWPTTQRDALYWSHICPIKPNTEVTVSALENASGVTGNDSLKNLYKLHTVLTSDPVDTMHSNMSKQSVEERVLDEWMVINMSTDYLANQVPPTATPMIRLGLEVVLFCRTEFIDGKGIELQEIPHDLSSLPRRCLRTRLVYMANINPGGWVPAAGLRSLARREYPRFLKRFSSYVIEQTENKSPLF